MQRNNGSGLEEPSENSLTPDQLQQIINLGELCNQATNTPVITMAFNQVLNRKVTELMASSPKESQKREDLYRQHLCLVEVWEEMIGAVNDAKRVLSEQQEAQNPINQQKEYLDTQGFGLQQ